ncbi:hypothetical protein DIPPA_20290 [Diplonema papillatum]|nr:hypothetical protein DIPPA_20290 [Diplonema papillatum]
MFRATRLLMRKGGGVAQEEDPVLRFIEQWKGDERNEQERLRELTAKGVLKDARSPACGDDDVTVVIGSRLMMCGGASWGAGLSLYHLDTAREHHGRSGVLAALQQYQAAASGRAPCRDAALVKLAVNTLNEPNQSCAISTIAKNIDFATADEWGRSSGRAYRREQLEWIQEMNTPNEGTRDYTRDVAFETKVPFAEDEDYAKRSSLLQAALEWNVGAPASPEQRTHAEPSASLFVGETGGATESDEPRSVLEVKEKLFAMMSRCVAPPKKERFGFEVNGLLGAPDTTYRCLLCDTEPRLQMDLLLHAESRGHQLASEECTAAARADEEAFLHALRMQQALSWEDSVQAEDKKRTPGYVHSTAKDAAREQAELNASAS